MWCVEYINVPRFGCIVSCLHCLANKGGRGGILEPTCCNQSRVPLSVVSVRVCSSVTPPAARIKWPFCLTTHPCQGNHWPPHLMQSHSIQCMTPLWVERQSDVRWDQVDYCQTITTHVTLSIWKWQKLDLRAIWQQFGGGVNVLQLAISRSVVVRSVWQ